MNEGNFNGISYPNLDKIKNILFIAGVLFSLITLVFFRKNYFWDLELYSTAISAFLSGVTAYSEFNELRFVYSPYVLVFFSFFGSNLSLFLLLFYGGVLLFLLNNKLTKELFVFSIMSAGAFVNEFFIHSIMTGNLTLFLHFLIIGIASCQTKRSLFYFLMVILIASIVKPYLLAYLILGFTIWTDNKKQYFFFSLLTIVVFTIVFLSQMVFTPELYDDFIFSLHAQAIGDSERAGRDVGYAPYFIFGYFFDKYYALLFHVIFVISISILALYIYRLISKHIYCAIDLQKILFFMALIVITLLNPRMKIYDFWIISSAGLGIAFTIGRYFDLFTFKSSLAILFLFGMLLIFLEYILHISYIRVVRIYLPLIYTFFLIMCFLYWKKHQAVKFNLFK
ncbi:hypothetical protein [Aliikangiella maris]|uniref:DUF2029 domain-containing protein n=2 Tax=Aliikangiella maris TaxID=3162458 RepID=A0ABV3MP52_9GAMM